MDPFESLILSVADQVATVTIRSRVERPTEQFKGSHWELAAAFNRLREDDSVRVVVLTGQHDQFKVPPPAGGYQQSADPAYAWQAYVPIIRCHEVMAQMEKPIVARVNGDAIGFGQSLAFACDLIIARRDARFMDHHMGGTFQANYGGQVQTGGHGFSLVPGDGGAALIPLYMSPAKAKEYLMLCKPYSAEELAAQGIINYAVAPEELDAKVSEMVAGLLSKGAYALAWTKRVVNRSVVQQLNLTLDASLAYEMVNFMQWDKLGGQEHRSLGQP